MKTISRHQVERLFPRDVYERGLKYYHEKRVHGISYNAQKQEWFAEVHGSESYYVDIGLNELQNGTIKAYCECPAFDTYRTCKHLVAVLLKIADQHENHDDHHLTASFIDSILSIPQTTGAETVIEKMPMKVEYFLYLDRKKISLQLKTGIDHCYVIHHIRDFLQHVLAEEKYPFTKKFTFHPNEHYFLQQDIELFKELYAYIQTGDLFTDKSYVISNAYDRRNLLIPPLNFSRLLEKLSERNTVVLCEEEQFSEIHIIHDELPFSFSVIEKNNRPFIKIENVKHAKVYLDYQCVFQQGTFYFLSEKQLEIAKQIRRTGIRDLQLPLESEMVNTFFSEALPILSHVTDVEIDQKIQQNIVEYPLKAELYLDQKDDNLVGKLLYRYGNYSLNPFSQHSTDKIIVRDVEKEQKIMRIIEQSDFHYNGKELYFKMTEDEVLYDFLYKKLPLLEEYVDLFLTDSIQKMIFTEIPTFHTNVSVDESTNLLEVGFDMTGVDETEIASILQAVVEKKRYYRLDSGKILSLQTNEYERIRNLLKDLRVSQSEIKTNKLTLPAYRGLQFDEWEDEKTTYHASFKRLIDRLKRPEKQIYPLPSELRTTLRKYQETGYQWLKSLSVYQLGGILADDMGLGKTVQTIAYLLSERSDKPHLVVVPASVVYNWRNECRKFAPSLKVQILVGLREERELLMEEGKFADVWITTYGIVRQDIDLYKEISFQSLILDEAQHIKNYFTKTSKAIREIQADKKFALSGTPIENSLDELWAIFQVVLPDFLPTLKQFRKMDREKISSLTRPFILRRLKEDVLTELPEKIESVHISELTKEQKELYLGYLQQLRSETSHSIANNRFQHERMKILAGLTRLRQICCHPSLFIENYEGRSGKLDELIELVQTFIANGKRMLIFSQFTSMHEIIRKELDQLAIEYFYLHGQTPANERVQMSEAFNRGEKDVFLISLRAGGTGLNLTGADTVILYDLWWNPAVEDQATSRAHRFGQKNVVQVIRFITDGTIEEKIYELQQKKRELIDQVIQPGETMLSSLSEEDIKELLNI